LGYARLKASSKHVYEIDTRYIVFAEESLKEKMEKEESLLDTLIGTEDCQHTFDTKSIFQTIENDPKLEILKQERSKRILTTQYNDDLAFFVFIEPSRTTNLQNSLERVLNSMGDFRVNQMIQVDQNLKCNFRLFSSTCQSFLVGLKNFDAKQTQMSLYNSLCTKQNRLKFRKKTFKDAFVAFQQQPEAKDIPSMDKTTTKRILQGIKSISFGRFLNRQKALEGCSWQIRDFNFSSTLITISIEHEEIEYEIDISPASTLGFAFCTRVDAETMKLTIPTSHSPLIYDYSDESDLDRRVRQFNWANGENVEFDKNFLIILTCKGCLYEQTDIRNILFCSQHIPVQLFDVHFDFLTATCGNSPLELNFEVKWRIGVLRSSRKLLIPENFEEKIHQILTKNDTTDSNIVCKALDFLESVNSLSFMANAIALFLSALKSVRKISEISNAVMAKPAPSHFVPIKTLVITPTRKIYKPELPIMSSRLLRKFKHETFLIISFRDETLTKLQTPVMAFDIISNGFEMFGEHFHFLSASGSQFREHHAYFMKASSADYIYEIRNQIVENSHEFKSVPQYVSRVGLFTTADHAKGVVCQTSIGKIDDVKAKNRRLVTDGAGKIRQSYANEVLNLNSESALVQFRLKGAKGVLLKVNDNDQDFLTAGESRLMYCAQAENALTIALSKGNILQVISRFNVLEESWWLKIVRFTYLLDVKLLREKTKIPIIEGCRLIGAPDPSGLLKNNQVYCSIKELDKPAWTLEGDILIFRNPCLHPGDLRTVQAVNIPELSMYKNVLLFPSTKDCQSSLPDDCSGGDLDGDEYGIIWDKKLIPQKHILHKPLDYSTLSSKQEIQNQIINEVNNQRSIAEFYTKNMSNDNLGRIATMHLALCDILPDGACDPLAIELAKCQSLAVDFPKTGISPLVPKEAIFKIQGHPDFMEGCYVSKKVLGRLYRRVCGLAFDDSSISTEKLDLADPDPNLVLDGHKQFLDEAHTIYWSYCYDMTCLMNQFGLKHEEEVYLGRSLKWHPLLESNKGKAMDTIKDCVQELKEKYQFIFSRRLLPSDKLLKASAWYVVSFQSLQENMEPFLSFGWIMDGLLCEIKKRCKYINSFPTETKISESLLNYFWKIKVPFLQLNLFEMCQCAKQFERVLKNNDLGVAIYGSVSVFLSDENSDLDICLLHRSQNDKVHILESIIPAIDEIVSDKTLSSRNPVIKCSIPWISTDESRENTASISCDISCNKNGGMKTAYIHAIYKARPIFLPVFSLLVTWARNTGIVKSGSSPGYLIPTAEFYAFILEVLKNEIPEVASDNLFVIEIDKLPSLLDSILDDLKTFEKKDPIFGQLIFTFFRNSSVLRKSLKYTWPENIILEDGTITFSDETVQVLAMECQRALHNLCYFRSIQALLFSQEEKIQTMKKILSPSLSADLGSCLSFHAQRFKLLSGADEVTLQPIAGAAKAMLQASGTQKSIALLRNHLKKICTNRWLKYSGRPIQNAFKYFMSESEILLFSIGSNDYNLVIT